MLLDNEVFIESVKMRMKNEYLIERMSGSKITYDAIDRRLGKGNGYISRYFNKPSTALNVPLLYEYAAALDVKDPKKWVLESIEYAMNQCERNPEKRVDKNELLAQLKNETLDKMKNNLK